MALRDIAAVGQIPERAALADLGEAGAGDRGAGARVAQVEAAGVPVTRAGRRGGLRSAISGTTLTAQVIWKRDRLTADQYVSLTKAFTDHGVLPTDHTPGQLDTCSGH